MCVPPPHPEVTTESTTEITKVKASRASTVKPMFPFATPESHQVAGWTGLGPRSDTSPEGDHRRPASGMPLHTWLSGFGRVWRSALLARRCSPFSKCPRNGLALIPQLVEVKSVVALPGGGHRMQFVALGRRGKPCEWVSEPIEWVPNERVVVRAQTDGVTTTATRQFEEAPEGSVLRAELEYRFDVPWPQRVLLPLMEFQARRPMRKQLRGLLELVKVRVEHSAG